MDRITKAYHHALHLPLTDTDRIVLMSDCHRGDGSLADNFLNNKNVYFAALSHYLRADFTYIELGDGDELWENKAFAQIADAHGDVFWKIDQFCRDGRFYMLYGNHDMQKHIRPPLCYFDESTCRHCTLCVPVAEAIRLDYYGNELFLLHGHQADFFNDRLWKIARFLVRHFWKPLELLGLANPASTASNPKKQTKVEQSLRKWSAAHEPLLLAGHTHRAAFSRPREGRYFNDGCCVHPSGITALEIENGEIQLVKWRVMTRADGTLFVGRIVLQPAEPLCAYFG